MADSATARLQDNGSKQSVGELVSLAITDLTRLIRCEVELAKTELRADVRRLGLAAALTGIAVFAGFLVLVMLCFAYAYGLITIGVWPWLAFIYVALTCIGLAAVAGLIVALKMRRISGLRRTRASVHDDLALLRRDEDGATAVAPGAG
jgi:uncharacterized membrane protein YqjE